jgi:hypothetical protein
VGAFAADVPDGGDTVRTTAKDDGGEIARVATAGIAGTGIVCVAEPSAVGGGGTRRGGGITVVFTPAIDFAFGRVSGGGALMLTLHA